MNKIITITLIYLFVSCSSVAQKANKNGQTSNEKPNIVYILADDMGIGDISGLNPNSKIATPNIDRLIENGMTFTDAHTASAVCTPTRYGIITGRYPWRTKLKKGVLDGYSKSLIDKNIDTAPALLKRNGYETGMIGKWHLGWDWTINEEETLERDVKLPEYKYAAGVEEHVDFSKPFNGGPVDRGFEYFYGINASLDFPPYVFSENNQATSLPTELFKAKGPDKTKSDWKKDLSVKQKMQRKGAKSPEFDAGETLLKLTENSVTYINKQNNKKPFFLYLALTAPHTPVLPRKDFVGTSKAGQYGDFTQELDWSVGEILKALKEKGFAENTIVIFTADNGASRISFPLEYEAKYKHQPSREFKGRKGSLNEGGHRVPFIVHWPNQIQKAVTNNETINTNDLYATVADIVNENKPNQGVDSYSILSLLKGKNNYEREISVYSDFGGRIAIRKGDFKLIVSGPKKSQLYNLKEDISEKNNLYKVVEYTNIVKELEVALNKTITQGRTTKGSALENDGNFVWEDLKWTNK